MAAVPCPRDSFLFNGTLCACNPGYVYNSSNNSCWLFGEQVSPVVLSSGVSYDNFPFSTTIFSFDSIKRFTQSQAVFLETTLVMVLWWLGFCLVLRLFPLGSDGRSPWFKIRWFISRLDVSFATRHWLQDQKAVVKRKTELGGAFSIASWILFIGLFAALLYQIISKRSVEVHNVRATNEPDLASFLNDLQFNITTISSMSCAHLRGLGTLVTGNTAFADRREVPLATFANFSCINTTVGPTISLRCTKCQLIRDFAFVSWQFVDLPNSPASAVGFQFNLTSKNPAQNKHVSYVSGTLKNSSNSDDRPVTYRGVVPSVLKFSLFPRVYHNLHDLKLIQPLFHEFVPGSFSREVAELQTALQSSNDAVVNTTLFLNFLSSYIVEIDNQNILGPVSFLADLGGLYCISIGIFFYLLVQCEYRIKRLRNEDSIMRRIRGRRKAQDRWDKLRKYVRYTWASTLLDDDKGNEASDAGCTGTVMRPLHHSASTHKRRLPTKQDTVSLSIKANIPIEKKTMPDHHARDGRSSLTEAAVNPMKKSSQNHKQEDLSHGEAECRKDEYGPVIRSDDIPPLPPFEFGDSSEISMIDLQKNLQNLYEYNVMLREKLIAAQVKEDPPSVAQRN